MLERIAKEPVAIAAAVRSLILCGVAFGLEWDAEQIAAVMLALETVLALLTRAVVAPVDADGELRTKVGR